MPTKLKNLRMTKVDLVDEGANPDAHIAFAKRKTDGGEPADTQNLMERVLKALTSVFVPVAKDDAKTYSQVGNCQNVIDQMYEMNWSMTGSLTSIMKDDELDEATRLAMMQDSLAEYTAALTTAIPAWTQGNVAVVAQRLLPESAELVKQRDALDSVIGKASKTRDEDKPEDGEPDENEEDEDEDEADEKEPPLRKGKDDEDMKFDVGRMSESERATYEDLAKRYGIGDEVSKQAENAVIKGLQDQNRELAGAVAKLSDTIETNELTGIAKRYTLLGKKPEELVPVLKTMRGAGPEVFNTYVAGLGEQLALIEKSGVFGEIGKRGADMPSDAWSQIELHAADIRKARPELNQAQAITEACTQHPDLVAEYEKGR